MDSRTDLCIESCETVAPMAGISRKEYSENSIKVTSIEITDDNAAKLIGRQKGKYITIEFGPLMNNSCEKEAHDILCRELESILPSSGKMLVVGLGNRQITPDAIGPKAAQLVLATRHISAELAKSIGLENLRSVAVITPGVLGQTGIESAEIIKSTVNQIKPDAVLVIDAFAAKDLSRLGCTIQISNTGITPGSGVGNSRAEISKKTLGVPVFAVGIPTVVDASTLVYELTGKENAGSRDMIVTQREIDSLIERTAKLMSHSINCVLQPSVPPEILNSLN